MIDYKLIGKINKRRCFALVGSGPSCEMGYPTWEKLCVEVLERLRKDKILIDEPTYQKYLEGKKYPNLLRQAEIDLKDRSRLVNILEELIKSSNGSDIIYSLITKWPFTCYLTTNYDDELQEHLVRLGVHYSTIRNTKDELVQIRDGISNLIVKIHSDFKDPINMVITSGDYREFVHSPAKAYLRDKLKSIFQMFDMLVVGHSISDPNIQIIMESAKEAASPDHPIYFITSGLTKGEIREYRERYNIIVFQYENGSNAHKNLRRLLATLDHFIIPRSDKYVEQLGQINEIEVSAASSIFLYRKLFEFNEENPLLMESITESLVLKSLENIQKPGKKIDEVMSLPPISTLKYTAELKETVLSALSILKENGLVESDEEKYWNTQSGEQRVKEVEDYRILQEDQALGQFIVDLQSDLLNTDKDLIQTLRNLFKDVLIEAFRTRGLTITRALCSSKSIGVEDLPEIFRLITNAATKIANNEEQLAFIDAAYKFIVTPTSEQKDYLLSMSQGYFLYHMVGMDPSCSKFRIEIFNKTLWFFDSSVILPILAKGCYNNEYAADLFNRVKKLNVLVLSTEKLLSEVIAHLGWAVNFMRDKVLDSFDVLAAATGTEEYRQNLFLDGCVRQAAEGKISNFNEYLNEIFPKGIKPEKIKESLRELGIVIISISDLENFDIEQWGDIVEIEKKIKDYRTSKGTWRGDDQIAAEGEMYLLIRALRSQKVRIKDVMSAFDRVFFVSQSHVLDRVTNDNIITWSPESVYRYVTSIPGQIPDKDLLQQCMLQEFYYAGINFIDVPRYLRTFGSIISQSRLTFDKEKERYIRTNEKIHRADLEDAFESTPDLEKPFFVSQMQWNAAVLAENFALKAKENAEKELTEKRAEIDAEKELLKRKNIEREKQVQTTIKHYKDPKFRRKKAKQSKKRQRKKKK